MNLFEKIDLFYKMAQQLEDSSGVESNEEPIETNKEFPVKASAKQRMKKLSSLIDD
jgi:hypothetical protein